MRYSPGVWLVVAAATTLFVGCSSSSAPPKQDPPSAPVLQKDSRYRIPRRRSFAAVQKEAQDEWDRKHLSERFAEILKRGQDEQVEDTPKPQKAKKAQSPSQ